MTQIALKTLLVIAALASGYFLVKKEHEKENAIANTAYVKQAWQQTNGQLIKIKIPDTCKTCPEAYVIDDTLFYK